MNKIIAGLDEVGNGAIAGPLVIAIAAFNCREAPIEGIGDSKKIGKKIRERLAPNIVKETIFCNIGWAEPKEIDTYGLSEAWQLASMRALISAPHIDELYIDGLSKIHKYSGNQTTVVRGDASMWEIGAASIIAKVSRDNEMFHLQDYYEDYDWKSNVGYGTKKHYELITENGISKEHRMLFLRKFLKNI